MRSRFVIALSCLVPLALQAQDIPMPPARIDLSGDGDMVTLSGPIGPGTGRAFAETLAHAPQAKLLHLESPGGLVNEARSVAALTRQTGLDTYVASLCASACTQIFYAGHSRWLRPEAKLGFHGYGTLQGHTATTEQIDAAQDVERRSYGQAGLAGWFVDHIFATPNTDLWLPTTQELLASHFATDVTVEENPLARPAQDGLPSVNRPIAMAGQQSLPHVIGP